MLDYVRYFNKGKYDEAIVYAAYEGDLEYVSKCIKLVSPFGISRAFEKAAMQGHTETLLFIWENAVIQPHDITWGLSYTTQNGHIETLLKIIEIAGSKIDTEEYSKVLKAAATNNQPHIVEKILEIAKEEISNLKISEAFADAAYSGHIAVVTKLYEVASDKIELDGVKAALWDASKKGHTEVVLKILEVSGKADIAIAFQNAAGSGHANLITAIIETAGDAIMDEAYRSAFNVAASKNKLDVLSKIWEVASGKITTKVLNKSFSQAGDKGYAQIAKKIWEVASEKIDNKLLLEAVRKSVGSPEKAEFVKAIIELAGTKISKNDCEEMFENLVIKGNFDAASKFQKMVGYKSFTEEISGTNIMVSAILNGLEKSIEPNKYQAFSQLFAKAGIEIPNAHQHKLEEVKDNKDPADFEFINGLAHKLAKYYLTSNQPTEWLKIVNAMQNLDNDFALEVVTINGLIPEPFAEDTMVYRGMHFTATDEELSQFFDYGIRGASQKVLGYYVNKSWNDAGKSGWSDGGTYVSTSPRVAAKYALECINYNINGVTTCGVGGSMGESERKFVFEIQLPKGSPKIFGGDVSEFEMVPSYIKGEDIIAIYEVNRSDTPTKVFINPNAKSTPQLELNDYEKAVKLYNSLNSPYGYIKYGEKIFNDLPYTTQEDFYTKYTNDHYAADQAKLKETYYSNKPSYTDLGFKDAMVGECNPDYHCC